MTVTDPAQEDPRELPHPAGQVVAATWRTGTGHRHPDEAGATTKTMRDLHTKASAAVAAGGLAACCTVHLLVIVGVVGGLGGLAVGGIAAGAGVAAGATIWLVGVWLRRRARGRAACRPAERHGAFGGGRVPR
jgi:hypothetical protein